jgi:hypothetical protein
MFVGHFAVGLGAKRLTPQTSLGTLFLAAQFIDLLWPTFLLTGLERVEIEPGNTVVTPLNFVHYPWTHSLLMVIGWAVLTGGAAAVAGRSQKPAFILGGLVLSHWLLDALSHRPDLPVLPGGGPLVGLGLWNSLPATLAVELALFGIGIVLYARATTPRDRRGQWGFWGLAVFLPAVYLANVFGPPPPSVAAIGWSGQAQWLLVAWGYWVDRHRRFRA